MPVNFDLLDEGKSRAENQLMVEKTEDFVQRFERLRGGMSFEALSQAIERKTGQRISAQSMHKWTKGGNIKPENLKAVCQFFGVTELYMLHGMGPMSERTLEDAIRALPAETGQQTLDFVEYQIGRARELFASDRFADYMVMINRLKEDMKRRRGEK